MPYQLQVQVHGRNVNPNTVATYHQGIFVKVHPEYMYQVQSADILTSIDTGKPLNNRVHVYTGTQMHKCTM